MPIIRSLGLACFWGLLPAQAAFATTRYVDVSNATPAAPYTSWVTAANVINLAIGEAVSGDEIWVAPGVYLQNGSAVYVPFDKTLTLRGTQGRAAIIDGQGLSRCLLLDGTNSLVEGFTLRNGAVGGIGDGGGAYLASQCTLRDCLIVSNRAYYGGGVGLIHSAVVENCTLQDNRAGYSGGGVYFHYTDGGLVRNCIITGNLATNNGGGIDCEYAPGTISNCWIEANQAHAGGGVDVSGGAILVNTVMAFNQAFRGGGVFSYGEETNLANVVNCTIVSNTASDSGGGVYAGFATRVLNTIVYHNTSGYGPDLSCDASCVISNCCAADVSGGSNFTNAPAFADAAGGDYHLATASFCVDAGLASAAPGDDFDGGPRPQVGTPGGAALPDVGAFEYRFHFSDIDFTASNIVDLVWDEQDGGIYALDASVPGLVIPFWQNLSTYTNPGLAPGQFGVHMQTLTITPPVPAHAAFRLRISRASTPGKRGGR